MLNNFDRLNHAGMGAGSIIGQKTPDLASSLKKAEETVQPGDSFEPAGKIDSPTDVPALAKSVKAPRAIWAEVEKLAIWNSIAPLNTPLASALSVVALNDLKRLFGEMETRGFSFSYITDPNKPRQWGSTTLDWEGLEQTLLKYNQGDSDFNRLTVTLQNPSKPQKTEETLDTLFSKEPDPPIKQAKVHNFRDLRDLEGIIMQGDLDTLENPELARQLKELKNQGAEFHMLEEEGREGYNLSEALKNRRSRPVGLYGAYRALEHDKSDRHFLWVKAPAGGYYPLQGPEDLETIQFFLLGKSVPRLDTSPLARRLRDLGSVGITFHRGDQYETEDALSIYHALSELGYCKISMSMGRVAKEEHEIRKGEAPTPSRHLLELADYYSRNIVPKIEKGEITPNEGKFYLHGLARANAPLPESFQTIGEMRDFEHELQPGIDGENLTRAGVISYNSILNAMAEGESQEKITGEYKDLRLRSIEPGVASQAIVHFREKLKPRSFSEEDFKGERERLLEIAPFATNFDDVPKTRQTLQIEVPEPYSERLQALRILADAQSHRKRKWDGPTPMQDASQDYLNMLPWPRTGLIQAARLLGRLNDVMADKVGLQQTREIYSYLQRGIQQGAFGENVLDTFSREFELAQNVDFTLNMLQPDPPVKDPYEERAEAARLLRDGIAGLEPRKIKAKDEFLGTSFSDVDEAAEDYRFLLGIPGREQGLREDAVTLADLHQTLNKWADWEKRREIFKEYKLGKLGSLRGSEMLERLRGELGLSENLDVTLRALRGEYSEPFEERRRLQTILAEGLAPLGGKEEEKKPSQDYRLLLEQHCSRNSLAFEAEALMTLHRNLVPGIGWQASRDAFGRLMTSLREGPWTGIPLDEAVKSLLNNYLLEGNIEKVLGSLDIPPEGSDQYKGVDQDEDFVIIGGVKLKVGK